MKRAIGALVAAMFLAACGNPGFGAHENVQLYLRKPAHGGLSAASGSYLGVYERGVPQSYGRIFHFAKVIGHHPNLAVYYSTWGEPFQLSFADRAKRNGAAPIIQIDPRGVSLEAIAAGRYDAYLLSYARDVHAFGSPVVIGFGHEMNGPWYPWGIGHVFPQTWIAAWRHIVRFFRVQGVNNVTWMWTVNALSGKVASPVEWWPGSSYVTWIGIDGFYYSPTDSFSTVFGSTIRALRKLTSRPILLSETAVAPTADLARNIPALFNAIRVNRLLGLVWFDYSAKEDWRLEDDPAALAIFRRGVRHYKW